MDCLCDLVEGVYTPQRFLQRSQPSPPSMAALDRALLRPGHTRPRPPPDRQPLSGRPPASRMYLRRTQPRRPGRKERLAEGDRRQGDLFQNPGRLLGLQRHASAPSFPASSGWKSAQPFDHRCLRWFYTYGPPMAVAPLPNVRQVVEYALTEMPPEQIWLGVPTYGRLASPLLWRGDLRPVHLPPGSARARRHGAAIQPRRDRPGALVPPHRRGRRGPMRSGSDPQHPCQTQPSFQNTACVASATDHAGLSPKLAGTECALPHPGGVTARILPFINRSQ